jgi:hypothetical protein
VSGNILSSLPASKLKLPEHVEGGSDERQLVNTVQLSCEKEPVGMMKATPGLVLQGK